MMVKLVRHTFPDRPDWTIIDESIPLGKIYEVRGYDSEFIILNHELQEVRPVGAFLLRDSKEEGWLPCVCFEKVDDYGKQNSSKSPAQIQES
jgi:hypothetical protein